MKIQSLVLVAALAAGCVKQDPPPGAIQKALPTSDQVAIKLPQSSMRVIGDAPAVGQLASFYAITLGVTLTFNGGSAWVLTLVHTIAEYPVTSVNGDVYTWGPWSGNALDPGMYKLDVTANADGTFDYVLSGHAKSDATNHFLPLITGHADPRPGELRGNGNFLVDFDNARAVNPIVNANSHGQVDVHYDLAQRHLDAAVMSVDAPGQPVSADYAYDETATGGGDMTFTVQAALAGSAQPADIALRSRWLQTGAGRGDARITGGPLGPTQAIASECWGSNFLRVFYTDNVNYAPTEGDPAQCAFSTVSLP